MVHDFYAVGQHLSSNRGVMSSWFWFIAGFVSCLAFSGLSVAFLVWRTPPAAEPAQDPGLQSERPEDRRVDRCRMPYEAHDAALPARYARSQPLGCRPQTLSRGQASVLAADRRSRLGARPNSLDDG